MDSHIRYDLHEYSTTLPDPTIQPVPHIGVDNSGINVGTILWAIFDSLLFVCILGGNILTIIAIRTCRRLRGMISNLFILSLAISDVIVGLSLPYHLSFYLGSGMGQSHGLCLMRFFLLIFACSVSILTLIAIAVDRYIAIIYALHYRRYMTRRVAFIIITFNWIFGASVAVIPMLWNNWSTAHQCEFDEVLPPWYMAGFITPGFILIWMFMLLVYWRIMREASKHARQLRHSIGGQASAIKKSDWKSVQIVVFIMGCFSICWLPYFIVACAQIFSIFNTASILYKAAFSLAMTNSALNPIIYSWKNSNFRQAFGQLLRCQSPNNCQLAMDASQYSIRSHYLARQQSSNGIIIVPITPEPLESQRVGISCVAMEADCCTETNMQMTPTIMACHSSGAVDADSISGSGTECGACIMCKNLLRKSLKHNIIQRAIDDEMAKYTTAQTHDMACVNNDICYNSTAVGRALNEPNTNTDSRN